MAQSPRRATTSTIAMVCAVAVFAACSDRVGPGGSRAGQFGIAPRYQSAAAGIVDVVAVRVLLFRMSPDTVALDTVVAFPAGEDSLRLSFNVRMEQPDEEFTLFLRLIGPARDTVFTSGPDIVRPAPAGASPPEIEPELEYVGIGANAAAVVVTSPDTTLFFGGAVVLQATAFDANQSPIPGTPIEWISLDPLVVIVPAPDSGRVIAGTQRGTARIVAQTLTGQADTVRIGTQPVPGAITAESGSGQTAPGGAFLAQPLVARVTAADGLGVRGVWVRFAVTAGGGSLGADSVRTDSTGRASVSFRIGQTGPQTVQATTAALPGQFPTFAATVQAGPPASIAIVAGDDQSAIAGSNVTVAPRVVVTDSAGRLVSGAPVTFGVTLGGGSVAGATPVTGANGEATVIGWTLGAAAGPNGLRAFVVAPPADTFSVTFTATGIAGPPSQLQLVSGDAQSDTAGSTLALPLVVRATDANGNSTGGVPIAWTATAGLLSAVTVVTDAAGLAQVTWTLPTTAGSSSATAGIAGTAVTRGFTATVRPAAANRVAFAVQPTTVAQSAVIAPPVEIEITDRFGNRRTADTGTAVSVAIATNPSGGTLGGTPTRSVAGGIASFADLTIDVFGTGYTLVATAAGLAPDTSAAFDVRSPPGQVFWTSVAGGNWSAGANWSTGVPPGPTDTAFITLGGTYTVTLDVNATLAGLALGGASGTQTVTGTARTLTLNGAGAVGTNGVLSLSGGSIGGTGPLTSQGQVTLLDVPVGVAVANAGVLRLRGTTALNGALSNAAVGEIRVEATGGADGNVTTAAGWTNAGTVVLTHGGGGGGQPATLTVNGTLVNDIGAVLRSEVGLGTFGARTLVATLDNRGLVDLQHELTVSRPSAAHVNSGTITVTGGNLTVTQSGTAPSFTSSGTITVGTGRTLSITGGAWTTGGSTLNGAGALALTNVVWALGAGYTVDSLVVSATGGSIGGTGPLTNQGQVTLLDVPVGVAVANEGVLRLQGTTALNGAVSNAVGAELRVEAVGVANAQVTTAAGWTNAGTVVLTHGGGGGGQPATLTVNGVLVNDIGAVLRSEVGLGTFGARTLVATLDNRGRADLQHELTVSRPSAAHVNSGTITVTGGNLTVTQSGTAPSFTSTGTITVGTGRALAVTGGTFTNSGAGLLQGTGTLDVATTTFTNAGLVGPGLSPGALTLTGNYSQATGGTLAIELGGTTAGTQYDQLIVTGAATPAGTLNVTLIGGFTPALGQQFTVLTFASRSGDFGTVDLPGLGGGLAWQRTFTGTAMVLEVITAVATPARNTWAAPTSGLWSDAARWSEGRVPIAGDTVEITAAGTYTVTLDLDATVDALALGGTAGTQTLDATGAQTLTLTGDASVNSNGIVDVASGDLTLAGGNVLVVNGGKVHVGIGRTLAVGAGDASGLTYLAGAIGGPGTLHLTPDAQLNLDADLTIDSLTVVVDDAAVNPFASQHLLVAPFATLELRSTVGANINLVVENHGTMIVRGPQSFQNDSLLNAAGAVLTVEGTATDASLTVNRLLENAGVVELTQTQGSSSAFLAVVPGTLRNLAAGAVVSATGAGSGTRRIDAILENQGNLTVLYPVELSVSRAAASHSNTGVVNVTGGDFTVRQTGAGTPFTLTTSGAISVGPDFMFKVVVGTLDNAAPGVITVQGMLVDSGPLFHRAGAFLQGDGTLDLRGVTGGTIAGDVLPAGSGAVTLGVLGDLTHTSTSTYHFELGGTGPGESDLLDITGQAGLAGTLQALTLLGGYVPQPGDRIPVMAFGSSTGAFSTLLFPAVVGLQFDTLTVVNADPVRDTLYVVASAAPGALVTWTGAAGNGLWSDAGNWDAGRAPGATDIVSVALGGVTVNLDADATVRALEVTGAGSQLTHTANTLQIDSSATFGPGTVYSLAGIGMLSGAGTVSVFGTFAWDGGTQTGGGVTTLAGEPSAWGGGAKVLDGRTLGNGTTVLWSQGDVVLANGGTIVNVGNLERTGVASAALAAGAAGGLITNQGSFLHSAVGTTVVSVAFSNENLLDVAAGTLDIAGPFTHTELGVLRGAGTIDLTAPATVVAFDGAVAPGASPGILSLTGVYGPGAPARLDLELGGTTVGTQYDQLAVSGAATLNGTLNVTLVNGFTPSGGEQFTVLTFASRTGDFTTVNLPALPGGLTWQRTFTGTSMVLGVMNAFAGAPPGTDAVWTGASSTSWTDAGNWTPGVPGATDDVYIRADAANPLIVTGVRTIDSLAVQTGATMAVSGAADTLVVGGSLAAGSPAITGSGAVRLTGANQRARGQVPTLVVTGTITASDSLRIVGNLLIGGTGRLNAGAFRVAVEGTLTTAVSGTLGMTGLDDRVDVAGSATFGGGDSFLTGGVLTVAGNFTQSGTGPRVRATDAHRTRLTGGAGQTVGFADPLANGFGQLTILTADSLHVASLLPAEDIVVADSLAAGAVVVRGTGYLVAKNPSGGNLVLRSDAGRPVRVRAAGLRLFGNVALVGADVGVQVSELEYWGDAPVTIPADPRVTFTRLTVRGTRSGSFASGQIYTFQDVIVTDDASLSVGGATVNLTGDLSTSLNGVLAMAAGDVLNTATATFGGGSTAGLLTGGTLRVRGDLDQSGDPESFAPSGTHLTVLDGGGGTLTFADPAQAGGSHFHHLNVEMSGTASNGGEIVITGNLFIRDTAQFAPSGIVGGSGNRITVVGSASIIQSSTAAVLTSDVLRFGGAVNRNAGAVVDGDTVEFFGTNQTVPTNLSPAFALKVTGDSVLFTGSTTWRGMLVTGLASIGGATVSVDSTFRTSGTGAIRMTGPAGRLSVRGEARFEGGSTAGRMTGGTLDLGGSLTQGGPNPFSFAPSGSHLTQFRNFDLVPGNPTVVPVTVSMSAPFTSHFHDLLIDQEISATLATRVIATGSVTKPEFATMTGTVLEVAGDLTAGGALNGIIDLDTAYVAGVFTPNLSSQDYRITVLVMTGAAQTLPSFPHYATVAVWGDSVVIAGGADILSLIVEGSGLADIGGAVQVYGSLQTRDQGRLRMAGGSLFVGGDATFGGGSTAGLLTGGILTIGAGLTQTAANSPSSFAASLGHTTEFANFDFRAIDFATPDSLASHFGTLSVGGAGELRLESDVHVVGQLRTPAVAGGVVRKLSGLPLQGRRLVTRGVDVDSLDLEALRLVVADGVPIGRFRDVRFVNQDPGVDRLEVRRAGGTYTFERLTFTTTPDPGFAYVSVVDADGTAATPFHLIIDQASPADPGLFTRTDGIATLTWAAGALLSGTVRNAVGGAEIVGATVDLKQGANAAQSDPTLQSTATDGAGGYSFTGLAAGDYTLWVSASGFIDGAVTGITVTTSGPTGVDVALSPLQQPGETRIVLSWGATPADLDSWLVVPDTVGGPPAYVAYGSPGASASYPFSQLDNDMTNGYGPETITIYQQLAGTYQFRVHDYAGGDNASGTALLASEARVDVYQNNELVQTFHVPNAAGTLWTVFELNGGTITQINTMSGAPPGSPIAGAATQLAFAVEPSNTSVGAIITPPVQVAARDAFGALVTDFTGVVTVTLYNGTGLTGTTSVAAVGGVATFSDLSISEIATGYTLLATVEGSSVSSAFSAFFDVTAPAQIGGFVRTAVDTAPIAGASVQLKQGANATTGDPVYQSTLTDGNGGYFFPVPDGQYTLFFGAPGLITTRVAGVTVAAGQTTTVAAGLTAPLAVGQTRIVLSWGGAPPELDSHLLGPDTVGEFHVYYGTPGDSVNSPFALLHQDIGNGQGPEAVTIYAQQAGVYEFRVHDWVGGADPADSVLRTSGARVDVYQGTQQVQSFTVPNQLGTLWKVFQLNGATITELNTIVGDAPGTPIGGGGAAAVAAGLQAGSPPRTRQGSR